LKSRNNKIYYDEGKDHEVMLVSPSDFRCSSSGLLLWH